MTAIPIDPSEATVSVTSARPPARLTAVRTVPAPAVAPTSSTIRHDVAVEDLSPREAEVLRLITNCFTNQEISETLYLSLNSVKTYIRGAYRKIGASTRSQAVVWGVRHGMLEPLESESGLALGGA